MSTVSADSKYGNKRFVLSGIEFSSIRPEVNKLLVEGEKIAGAFQCYGDQVIFTDRRVFVVIANHGFTGLRVSCFSYPYSKIRFYGVEMAGTEYIERELVLVFGDGLELQFNFKTEADVNELSKLISSYVL